MTEEIHDTSRLDAYMASRRRAMFLHAAWRPMLAGAVGAALIVATVWAAMPKFHYNDIEIPRVTVRDVTVDHVVPRDVPVDHVVPHDVPVDHYVPHDVPMPGPQASANPPTMGPDSPYAPKTPDERKFAAQPEYKTAEYHGRIVKSVDGRAISFEDGKSFWPAKVDASGKAVDDLEAANDSDPYIGDLGMCVPGKDNPELYFCSAEHGGQEVHIGRKPRLSSDKSAAAGPTTTPSATDMVMVDVYVASYPVSAMVDTGCSFPMSVPKAYADALIRIGLATKSGSTESTLADGSTQPVDVIVIKSIMVDGRTLGGVEASVSPSDTAPVLLGLGALNRLGPYTIVDGRLVFAGEQPA